MSKLFRENIFGTNKPEITLISHDLLACSLPRQFIPSRSDNKQLS